MLAPDAYDRIADQLTENDFYRRDHQLIYRAIRELAEKNRPFDAVTLGEWFESMGLSEQVAGGAYLIELATTTPSAANISAYAEIVRDKAVLRQLIDVGTEIVNDGFQPEGRDSSEILSSKPKSRCSRSPKAARAARRTSPPVNKALSGSLRRAADALRQRRRRHRHAHGLHRVRRDDRRPAAHRPDHPGRAPVDGQDDARAEHGRIRRDQDAEGGGGVLDGNVGLAAGAAPDLLGRPHQRHAPAHRPARGRGLEPRHQRHPHAARRQGLHRRHPGAVAGRAARQGAPPQARARPRPDRDRLPAADAGARQQREPRHRNLRDLALAQGAWRRN